MNTADLHQALGELVQKHGPVPASRVYRMLGSVPKWGVLDYEVRLSEAGLPIAISQGVVMKFSPGSKKAALRNLKDHCGTLHHHRYILSGPRDIISADQVGRILKTMHCIHGRWVRAPSARQALQFYTEVYVIPRLMPERMNTGTATGRFSSGGPSIQNISPKNP